MSDKMFFIINTPLLALTIFNSIQCNVGFLWCLTGIIIGIFIAKIVMVLCFNKG